MSIIFIKEINSSGILISPMVATFTKFGFPKKKLFILFFLVRCPSVPNVKSDVKRGWIKLVVDIIYLSGANSFACLFTLLRCVDTYPVCQLSYLRWKYPINNMNLFGHKTMYYIVAKSKHQKSDTKLACLLINFTYMYTYLQVTWSKLYTIS